MGDPTRRALTHQWQLSDLARAAIADQRAPLVLHPHFMPWLYRRGQLAPYATTTAQGLVASVGRDTRAQLWLLLDPGTRDDLPAWAQDAVRWWLVAKRLRARPAGVAGPIPGAAAIKAHTWQVWEPHVRGVGVTRQEVRDGAL
jgi:hypothetical protein